ncbi:MAG: hypothetical protein A3H98_12900 [Bacteroidetes bacterium RIFCSPLOWO2_02_FULL_36_8]|nr:MAG: hypothetical protein A3H98_12900 [Bacteroidetes bacterium RIFCSPLOWO2_02_FULL_36_8]OFY70634.1 MAG: hypothetical protein A3G23_07855 [Bacteroidetes bacterium RIFCSPLOWO2_12_FULL_37_12]
MQQFQKYLSLIESAIKRLNFDTTPATLYQPMRFAMSLGGKRLRPLFVLLAYQLFSKNLRKAIVPALSVELFHNFTLLHDDIMDQSPTRRGKPTVYSKWNVPTAILAGDRMLITVYEMLENLPPEHFHKIIPLFNRCAARVCEGQQLDMDYQTQRIISTEDYLKMIRFKTAELFGYCAELGATLSGATEYECHECYQFGINIGTSFQILDDVLDTYGDKKLTGKEVGGDISQNKKTFLLSRAYEKADKNCFRLLRNTEKKKYSQLQTKVTDIKKIFDTLAVLKDATIEIEKYRSKAMKHLYNLKKPESRLRPFVLLSDFIIKRKY